MLAMSTQPPFMSASDKEFIIPVIPPSHLCDYLIPNETQSGAAWTLTLACVRLWRSDGGTGPETCAIRFERGDDCQVVLSISEAPIVACIC